MEAIERARRGDGPTLIEAMTYRWYGHSAIDPRTTARRKKSRAGRSAIRFLARTLRGRERDHEQEDFAQIATEVEAEIDDAVDYAEKSPHPKPEDALTDVYVEWRNESER